MRVNDECISPYVCVHIDFIHKNNCDDWSQSLLCVQVNADFQTYLCCYFSLFSYRLRITVLHCLLGCIAEMYWPDRLEVRVQSVANSG